MTGRRFFVDAVQVIKEIGKAKKNVEENWERTEKGKEVDHF